MSDGRTWGLRLRAGCCIFTLMSFSGGFPVLAQTADPATPAEETSAAADPEDTIDPGTDVLEPNEIDALVAPVVLYPDPLLSLVLQASITPLDVVEAERFLAKREKDPSLTPDPDWDSSIVGLLNYPELVGSMSEYLDWTQLLGTAVIEQTDAVQASIQILRSGALDRGILVSNEVQNVVETDGVVMIAPASADQISVPQYDPVELLAALTPAEEPALPEEAGNGTTVVVNIQQPPPAEPAVPPAGDATVTAAAPSAAEPAPAAPTASAAAPTYYAEPQPTYMAAPPPVSYAAPQSSFWSTAATFAGGAAVGGLLGYVIGDDNDNNNNNDDGWDEVADAIRDLDDNDWDDFVDRVDRNDFDRAVRRLDDRDWEDVRDQRGRNVNISDSTIVVGNDLKRNELNAKLKNKRDSKVNLTGGQRTRVDLKNGTLKREGDTRVAAVGNRDGRPRQAERPRGLAPAKATPERGQNRQVAANRPAREVKLPGAKGGGNVAQAAGKRQAAVQGGETRQRAATPRRPGNRPQAADRAVAAGIDRPRDAQRASQRGAKSMAKSGQQRQPKAAANHSGGQRAATSAKSGGARPMGAVKSGKNTKRDANRGKKSLGKGGGKGGGKRRK